MKNEHAAPAGKFEGPEAGGTLVPSFQIQVTNAPYFGSGAGTAYLALTESGYCYMTSDPTKATSFSGGTDSKGRRFITTPDGWLSYGGATPFYMGSWKNISNEYQTWIDDGVLHLHGGTMCFYSDGANTWLYNRSDDTVGYTTCKVLPVTAP